MKVPAPPPDFASLVARLHGAGRMGDVAVASTRLSITRDYPSWDKLRFRTPPDELDHEEWWCALKLSRTAVRRSIPQLVALDGTPFHYALPDPILESVDAINRDASGTITLAEKATRQADRDRYLVSSLIEEAITSSQLEGAATSRHDAKELLRTRREPRDMSERMIVNNYLAMQRIVELKSEALTPELVMEIHRIVTDGTLADPSSAGRLQDDDATRIAVWGDGDQLLHRPPPVADLPARLAALCEFANEQAGSSYMPPVLRAITLHFMMGYDHYFEDGNGRTARAVFYWSMLNRGFWLTEYLTISRILKAAPAKYVRSFMLTEQDDGDLTYFFIHHLEVIRRAIHDLHAYLARKSEDMRSTRAAFSRDDDLNGRQIALLDRALDDPDATFTARTHAASHRVTPETARQDLLALEERGHIARVPGGREHRWVAAPTLAGRRS